MQQRTIEGNAGFEGELHRRKLDADFRISAKFVDRAPRTYVHHYNDSTIEMGDLESPRIQKPGDNKRVFRRGSPATNDHKKHFSNSTAEPSVTTIKESLYFIRSLKVQDVGMVFEGCRITFRSGKSQDSSC